jgi:flagellar basal-body rod modification protein FlgD
MSVASTSSSTATDQAALAAAGGSQTAADTSNQFLTMLVAQMQNQDPLNPMDNAEITTQMAQIQTVQGVQTLNTSMQGLSTQLVQLQALQAASMVGKQVTVPGNQLTINDGSAQGGYTLSGPSTSTQVQVLSSSGQVVDTISFGAQSAGNQTFNWSAGDQSGNGYTFKVTAVNGSNPVTSTPLMEDTVDSVSNSGGQLTLQLQNSGSVPYTTVQALN